MGVRCELIVQSALPPLLLPPSSIPLFSSPEIGPHGTSLVVTPGGHHLGPIQTFLIEDPHAWY